MNSQKHQTEHPKTVEDYHALQAWIIPKVDQFPRQRRFTLGERIIALVPTLRVGTHNRRSAAS